MVLPAEPHTHCLPSASSVIGLQQPAVTGAPPLTSLTYDTGCRDLLLYVINKYHTKLTRVWFTVTWRQL